LERKQFLNKRLRIAEEFAKIKEIKGLCVTGETRRTVGEHIVS
jgi:hypothetical protein